MIVQVDSYGRVCWSVCSSKSETCDWISSMIYFYVLSVGLALIHGIRAEAVYSQREVTVRVEPGAVECFYERAQKNQIIDFEYQGESQQIEWDLTWLQIYFILFDSFSHWWWPRRSRYIIWIAKSKRSPNHHRVQEIR